MALTNLSQITTSGIATGTDLNIRNITGVAATFTGNVTVGGTLTYDDVTNIDSVGLITARSGISVTGGDVNLTSGNLALASAAPMVVASNGSGSLRLGAGGSEKVRITSAGSVGIGTNAPQAPLHIFGSSDILFEIESTDRYSHIDLTDTSSTARITNDGGTGTLRLRADKDNAVNNSNIQFEIDGSEKVRITSAGLVGISETTPDSKLDILHSTSANPNTENLIHLRTDPGASYVTRGLFIKIGRDVNYDNSAAHYDIVGSAGNSGFHAFEVQGDEKLRITKDGNIGIGTENAVAKLDIITGTGDGTQNEANCLRLRNRGNNGNAMTLQVGVNTAFAGALNQGYAYLQGRFWGGGNNPILLNPKGGNVGIGRTSAHVL